MTLTAQDKAKRAITKAANLIKAQKLRKALRRPSGLKFVIADGIALLNGVQWDQVVGQSTFFLGRDYLYMLEQDGPENIVPRYVLIFEDEQPVAAVYLQIASVSGSKLGKKKEVVEVVKAKNPLALIRNALAPAANGLSEGLRERILVCGNLLSYGFHGVAFAEGVDKAALWPAVAEAIYRIRRAEKLSGQTDFILIKDIIPSEAPHIEVLSKLSYRSLETEPNMVLDIAPEWKNYDGYLASLASKYRSSVRQQILKPIEAAGCVVEHIADLEQYGERLHALYMQVHEKASLRLFTLPASYFAALEQAAGGNLLCSIIRRKDDINDLLGFIITLKDGAMAYGYHIGFDRHAGETLPLYLRLLHASIADAMQLGCSQLSLGRTALEPKARLGAQAQPITVWMRHRQPVMNVFVRNLLRVIPHEEAPERNPFKK